MLNEWDKFIDSFDRRNRSLQKEANKEYSKIKLKLESKHPLFTLGLAPNYQIGKVIEILTRAEAKQ